MDVGRDQRAGGKTRTVVFLVCVVVAFFTAIVLKRLLWA